MADQRTTTIHPDRVSEVLEATFPAADALRDSSVELLAELREAKATVFTREVERLRKTHPADHPLLLRAAARAASSRRFAADLRMEATRSKRPRPSPEDEAWILCGHLWTAAREPIPGATIALHRRADGRDQPVEATTTAKDGYFLLKVSVTAPTDEAERLAPVVNDLRREPTGEEDDEIARLRAELRELDARGRRGRLREPERIALVSGLERFAILRRIEIPAAASELVTLNRRIAALEPRAAENLLNPAESAELGRLRERLTIVNTAVTASLYLRALDRRGEVLFASETPLPARLGAVSYRDVELP